MTKWPMPWVVIHPLTITDVVLTDTGFADEWGGKKDCISIQISGLASQWNHHEPGQVLMDCSVRHWRMPVLLTTDWKTPRLSHVFVCEAENK